MGLLPWLKATDTEAAACVDMRLNCNYVNEMFMNGFHLRAQDWIAIVYHFPLCLARFAEVPKM